MPNLITLRQISEYVTSIYKKYQTPELLYHNLGHTENVVKQCVEIAANYSLDDTDFFILLTAAWFHDTGYLFGAAKLHEERGVLIMRDYLETEEAEQSIIKAVEECIMATKLPQLPKSLLDKIICDADTYNLGTEEFCNTDNRLKKETEQRENIKIDNWRKKTLELLEKHTYFTPYCQAMLDKGKQENIKTVRKKTLALL